MAECIYREAAIKAIYENDHFSVRECFGWRAMEIEEVLRAVPATPVPQWISVKKRLPENYVDVIVYDAISGGMFPAAIGSSGEWEIPGFRADAFNFTHWIPLPEPPKGENDG